MKSILLLTVLLFLSCQQTTQNYEDTQAEQLDLGWMIDRRKTGIFDNRKCKRCNKVIKHEKWTAFVPPDKIRQEYWQPVSHESEMGRNCFTEKFEAFTNKSKKHNKRAQ